MTEGTHEYEYVRTYLLTFTFLPLHVAADPRVLAEHVWSHGAFLRGAAER